MPGDLGMSNEQLLWALVPRLGPWLVIFGIVITIAILSRDLRHRNFCWKCGSWATEMRFGRGYCAKCAADGDRRLMRDIKREEK